MIVDESERDNQRGVAIVSLKNYELSSFGMRACMLYAAQHSANHFIMSKKWFIMS